MVLKATRNCRWVVSFRHTVTRAPTLRGPVARPETTDADPAVPGLGATARLTAVIPLWGCELAAAEANGAAMIAPATSTATKRSRGDIPGGLAGLGGRADTKTPNPSSALKLRPLRTAAGIPTRPGRPRSPRSGPDPPRPRDRGRRWPARRSPSYRRPDRVRPEAPHTPR